MYRLDKKTKKDRELGLIFAILCALIWGVLPIYWKSLAPIPSVLIMFYRMVLACALVFVINLRVYKWRGILEPLRKKGAILIFFIAGLLISTNWGLYIFMVNAGMIVQTSIGYYLEPLVVCIFGYIFFRERFEPYKAFAFAFAVAGVAVMLISYGEIPMLALVLALTFAAYAALKKKLQAPALLALFYETIFLVPIALPVIFYFEFTNKGAFANGEPYQIGLLFFSGFLTALPLSLFAMAANRINLITLGITEYISPSIGLILGIFVYNEPFDLYQFIGFFTIWIGLAIFTTGGIMANRNVESQRGKITMTGDIRRVTGGSGGEALLIIGSDRTAVYDTGMAWCGDKLADNIKGELGDRPLDYVLLSHTHYDHVGGLPFLRMRWPDLIAYGSGYGKKILEKQSALDTIRNLSQAAAGLFLDKSAVLPDYSDDHMKIDRAVGEGDRIHLGDRTVRVLETKGHTNCSLSFYLEEESILLLSESTGVMTEGNRVHASILSSYKDAMTSIEKCRSIGAKHLFIPHYLELPKDLASTYWDRAIESAKELKDFVLEGLEKGLSEDEMLEKSISLFWVGDDYQPLLAFMANMKAKFRVIEREFRLK